MNKNVILALVIAGTLLVLCILACVVVVFGTGYGSALLERLRDPNRVRVSVRAPASARAGNVVAIVVEIENRGAEPVLLGSIDVDASYMAGIAVDTTRPPFTESLYIASGDLQSFFFERPISPGETLVVRLTGSAVEAGRHAGEIGVCVDGVTPCMTRRLRTVVRE